MGDPREGMAEGKLVFRLHGEKLAGLWELVRIAKPGDKQDAVDAVQEEGRVGAAGRRVRRHRGAARQRRRQAARARRGARAARRRAGGAGCRQAARRRGDRPCRRAAARRCRPSSSRSSRRSSPSRAGGDWIVETKFDGYRLMARIDGGKAKLITRGGHDWTGEDEAARRRGRVARHRLGLARRRDRRHERATACPTSTRCRTRSTTRASEAIEYFVFDLPFHDGQDLRKVPLRARRALLRRAARAAPERPRPPQPGVRRPRRRRCSRRRAACSSKGSSSSGRTRPTSRRAARPGSSSSASCARSSSSAASPTAAARAARSAACFLGYLRRRRAALRRQRRHRLERAHRRATCTRAWSPLETKTPTLGDRRDHARPLVAAQRRRRALGQARAGRRGGVPRMDARRPRAPRRVRGAARSTSRRAR